jgi:hypothetical protein
MTNSTRAYHNYDLKKFHSTGTLFITLKFLRNLRMVSLSYKGDSAKSLQSSIR